MNLKFVFCMCWFYSVSILSVFHNGMWMYVYIFLCMIFYNMSILNFLILFYGGKDNLFSPDPNFYLNSEVGIIVYVSLWACDINGRVVTLAPSLFTYLLSLNTDPFFFLQNRSLSQKFHSSFWAFLFTYILNNMCNFLPFLFFSNVILVTWYLIGLICISEDIKEGKYWLIYLK